MLCDKCNKTFKNIKRHLNEVHGDEPPQKQSVVFCNECNLMIPANSVNGHNRSKQHKQNCCVNVRDGVEIISTAFKNRISTHRIKGQKTHIDLENFITEIKPKILEILRESIEKFITVKIQFEVFGSYVIEEKDLQEMKSFNTKYMVVTKASDLDEIIHTFMKIIDQKMNDFQERDSGWALESILFLELNINKFNPLRGSSYIPLPKDIVRKRGVLNIQNVDECCFAWSLVAAVRKPNGDPSHPSSYEDFNTVFNFQGMSFPMKLSEISKFEQLNNISINVYGIDEIYIEGKLKYEVVGPLHYTNNKKEIHINLLLISDDDGNNHYCLIQNLSKLVSQQISLHHGQKYFCDGCLQYFKTHSKLVRHLEHDCDHLYVKLPTLNHKINKFGHMVPENVLEYENIEKQLSVPFVVYADFESVLKPILTCTPDPKKSFSVQTYEHEPHSFAYYIKCDYDDSLSKFEQYRGPNSGRVFIEKLEEDIKQIYNQHLKPVIDMIPLTDSEINDYEDACICHICDKIFSLFGDVKVRDHCHLTGKYRGAAHTTCNLHYKFQNFIPIFFHNLNYDSHLFIKTLATNKENISVIAQTKEKYISFSKDLLVDTINDQEKVYMKLRFLDSFRFMPQCLEKLGKNLDTSECLEIKKFFPDNKKFNYIRQKGVFPYSYIENVDKLDEQKLPSIEQFYDKLRDENISQNDYQRACKVWDLFNCQTIGNYSDIYLKSDVLILADVFENFRKVCIKSYKLDPAHYFTTPGLSWDAMLKNTKSKLELLTDIDMLHFFKKGIRGGVSTCVTREAKANNKFLPNYDSKKPNSYIMYLDATNLYGHSMSDYLPEKNFAWLSENEIKNLNFFNISDNADVGYILEVDLQYPSNLHNYHDDLPFCPENIIPPKGKFPKLIPNLCHKTKYIIHYKNLKQCVSQGLILTKIHRVIKFNQSPWLKKYIDLNTQMRNASKNDFEKMFFKLMNNSVFGKTMENVDNRIDVKLVSHWEKVDRRVGAEILIAKPNFKNISVFDENLVAVQMNKVKILYNKPVYVGFTVLDLSKTIIYDFYYNYLKQKYKNNIKLLYTDTDSLIIKVDTDNFYNDMKLNLDKFDTSNYKLDNIHNIPINTSILGKMKDEYPNECISCFYGTGAKAYCVITPSSITKKAKGVKKAAIDNQLSSIDYKNVINGTMKFCKMYIFRSHLHNMYTEYKNKVALTSFDDKRYIIPHSTRTLAWGNCNIELHENCGERNIDMLLELAEEIDELHVNGWEKNIDMLLELAEEIE
jgi:hypothetical protein